MQVALFQPDEVLLAGDLQQGFQGINQSFQTFINTTDFPQDTLLVGGHVSATSPASSCVQLSSLIGVQQGQLINVPGTIQINILGSSCTYGSGQAAGSSPRIDVVCIQYTRTATNNAVREFINPTTQTQTTETIPTTQVDSFAIQVVHGTPSSTPVAPAVPNGWWGLAQVYVPANASAISSSNITDISGGYRTDGGHLTLTSQGLLQWVNPTTIGMPDGSTFQIGPTTLTDDKGTLTIASGTAINAAIPVKLSYNGLAFVLKPSVNPSSPTDLMQIQTAGGTTISAWDSAGNFTTSGNITTTKQINGTGGTLTNTTLSGTTTNSGTISGGTVNPASGTVAGDWTVNGKIVGSKGIYSIGTTGQYIGPNLNLHYPTTGSGYVWNIVADTTNILQAWMDGSNKVNTLHNTLDNGSGDASIAGQQTVQDLAVSGITGATTASRYVGGTSGGAPTTGTFAVNDYVVDSASQTLWLCTAGGSPGTWVKASPSPATDTTAGIVEIPQTPSGTPVSTVIMARPAEIELTTTSATTIFTETPANTGMFVVYLYARVVTATTTVTATLTYTSTSGAQTYTIWNAQNLPVGDNSAVPFFFQNVGGDTIELSCTAGTANQVYIDARLVAM